MVLRLRFSVAVAGGEGLALASIDGARQPEVTAVNRTSAVHKPRKDGNERCMYKPKSESGEWLQPIVCIY